MVVEAARAPQPQGIPIAAHLDAIPRHVVGPNGRKAGHRIGRRHVAVVILEAAAREVRRVRTAAAELVVARDAIRAALLVGLSTHGRVHPGRAAVWIALHHRRSCRRVEECHVRGRAGVGHEAPPHGAVGLGHLGEDVENGAGIGLGAAEDARHHQVQQARARERVDQRLAQRQRLIGRGRFGLDQDVQLAGRCTEVGRLGRHRGRMIDAGGREQGPRVYSPGGVTSLRREGSALPARFPPRPAPR